MQENLYPMNVRLTGKRCLVIGGGNVALRKVRGLLAAGATVEVIAPQNVTELEELAAQGKIMLQRQEYAPEMMPKVTEGCFLLVCATNDAAVNRAAALGAKAAGILVNTPAEPELSDFFVPSVLRRGNIMFTVSTGGASPALSRVLKKKLARDFPPNYAAWSEKVAAIRHELKFRGTDSRAREEFWRRALSDEVMKLVQQGETEQAEVELRHAADGFGLEPQDSPGDGAGEIRLGAGKNTARAF